MEAAQPPSTRQAGENRAEDPARPEDHTPSLRTARALSDKKSGLRAPLQQVKVCTSGDCLPYITDLARTTRAVWQGPIGRPEEIIYCLDSQWGELADP